jgi:hypothetical protein
MAKKKFRDIVVDGVKYAWSIQDYWEGHTLKVWKDKKILFELSDGEYGDTIGEYPVKPSLVARKIKEYEAKH